jgi:putative nucleotidyltransferase with HDIG domain
MKQKVVVNELRVGMYVAELDRPWSEAPFEPPFDLQGFTISDDDEISKIRALCKFVYVEIPDNLAHPAPKRPVRRTVVENIGDLRNVRYISPGSHKESARVGSQAEMEQSEIEPTQRPGFVQRLLGKRKLEYARVRADQGTSRQKALPIAHAGVLNYKYFTDPHNFQGDPHRATDALPKVIKVYNRAAGDTTGYIDQTTVEEELVLARDIIADTEKTYHKVMRDIEEGRAVNADAVNHIVKGLVASVVRNPDALAWLLKLRKRDASSYSHSMAVCVLALTVGRHLDFPERDLKWIGIGTLLQDIGKIQIPRAILTKSSELTSVERKIIQQHVDSSLTLLGDKRGVEIEVMDIIRSHHERYDGSGYPRGVSGEAISVYSTIAGLTDTYEALISERPYRPGINSLGALTEIYDMSDTLFPGAMVEQFIQCVGIFPLGSFVLMNNNQVGVVVSRNRMHQLKPKVLLLTDSQQNKLDPPQAIDLIQIPEGDGDTPWKIVRVVEAREYGIDPRFYFA